MSKAVHQSHSPKGSTSRWRAAVPNRGKRPPAPKTRGKHAKVAETNVDETNVTQTAAADPVTPNAPAPTRTHYQDLATTLRTALEAVAPQIPFWQVAPGQQSLSAVHTPMLSGMHIAPHEKPVALLLLGKQIPLQH